MLFEPIFSKRRMLCVPRELSHLYFKHNDILCDLRELSLPQRTNSLPVQRRIRVADNSCSHLLCAELQLPLPHLQ